MVVRLARYLGVCLRKLVWTAGGIWIPDMIPGEEKKLFSPLAPIYH